MGSSHLAAKIRWPETGAKAETPRNLPVAALRQWLLACNSVNHSLSEHESPIAEYKPEAGWANEEHSRLHQMAGALVVFRNPDPLLADVLNEVLRRPFGQMKQSKAVALYGLQAVRLLSESGALRTSTQIPSSLTRKLEQSLEAKSRVIRRRSKLESEVGRALQLCGFEPVHDVLAAPGLSADFRCLHRGRVFFVEARVETTGNVVSTQPDGLPLAWHGGPLSSCWASRRHVL